LSLATWSLSLAKQLGKLPLEARDASLELVHPLSQGRHFALDKLPSAIAYPLIDLSRGLLERFPRESIVEHRLILQSLTIVSALR
jgi:hypothetical protein